MQLIIAQTNCVQQRSNSHNKKKYKTFLPAEHLVNVNKYDHIILQIDKLNIEVQYKCNSDTSILMHKIIQDFYPKQLFTRPTVSSKTCVQTRQDKIVYMSKDHVLTSGHENTKTYTFVLDSTTQMHT